MARRVRSVFLSDLHLGTHHCRADRLLQYLTAVEPEHLYLVGDGIDVLRLQARWHWPETHTAVVRQILALVGGGTRATWLLGNHDAALGLFVRSGIGGIELAHDAIHVMADGRRALVVHGHEHDLTLRYPRTLGRAPARLRCHLGGRNPVARSVRRLLGMDHWSLAVAVKEQHPRARATAARFRAALLDNARAAGCHGVIAGHIHHAEADSYIGRFYANAGDWVDSCTAVVEDRNGRLSLVDWHHRELGAVPVPNSTSTYRSSPRLSLIAQPCRAEASAAVQSG